MKNAMAKQITKMSFGDVATMSGNKIVIINVKAAPYGHGQLVFVTGYHLASKAPFAEFSGCKAKYATV